MCPENVYNNSDLLGFTTNTKNWGQISSVLLAGHLHLQTKEEIAKVLCHPSRTFTRMKHVTKMNKMKIGFNTAH